jgi:peptide deformylase
MNIITVDCQDHAILRTKAEGLRDNEFPLAKEIAEKLLAAIKPYLPASGLAAPQIGVNKAMFIFSYDRDPKHLEVVINPTFIPLKEEKSQRWEGCFSTILCETGWQIANVYRFEQIKVNYLNLEGKRVERILEGFGARVFQHEYDHLQGILNIDRQDAAVRSFNSKEEMLHFMKIVKENDATHYMDPK